MDAKLGPSAPRARMRSSSASAKSASVGSSSMRPQTSARAWLANAAACSMRATSPASFVRRSDSTTAEVATSSAGSPAR